jgi:GAF domain-containing protein/biotin carboxyl carrier protein
MKRLSALYELAISYYACRDVDSLLKTFASQLGANLEARAVFVWLSSDSGPEMVCRGRWVEPGERFEPAAQPVTEGLLAEMLEAEGARRLRREEVNPDMLVHLAETHRERVTAALYAPIPGCKGVEGVVEVLNKARGDFTPDDAVFVEEATQITGRALDSLQAIDQDRLAGLATVERLTALYDIGRAFNSTLELSDLLPVMAEKIYSLLGAQACNLWLVDPEQEDLYFAQQVGEDPTTNEDERLPLGEGLIGQAAQQGEGRLVMDPQEEPLLAARQQAHADFPIETLMCAPLLKDDQVLGVVEVVNKLDGTPFDEDDLFLLTSVAEQAAIALNNANLLEAERKVHELDALLAISKEITSTLNLDRVLTTVVHQAATVVPFDRCAIGLFDRGQFVLGAVSGEAEVPRTREMGELREVLEAVASQPEAVSANQHGGGWEVNVPQGQEGLTRFLEAQGCNGFFALPLRDEQGTVGVLALLSTEADFLLENHLEVLSILASQTTVAIRNARLYQEVPLISVWKPLVEKKQKLLAIPFGRWLEWGWKVGLVVLALIFVPWKLRVEAGATVVPAERRVVSAEVEGVIKRVWVREGDKVVVGAVLAELDDTDNRLRLGQAQTDLALARRDLEDAEAHSELGAAAQARLRMEIAQEEVSLYRQKVEQARLRAPLAGVIVTPKVEEKVGKLLTRGEQLCELVDPLQMAVDLNVPETEEALIRPSAPVALKLNSFPTRTFPGRVERVGAQTVSAAGEQFFVVRGLFPNPDGAARTGMVGQAKITVLGGWFHSGWYPVGYVLFRSPARWVWTKVWSWLP